MGKKTILQRSHEEALESPAVWLCVFNAIKHVKHLEATRRSYNKRKEKVRTKRKQFKEENHERLMDDQRERRARKAAGPFQPKQRKRGLDVERSKKKSREWYDANLEHCRQYHHSHYLNHKDEVMERTAARAKKHRGTGSQFALSLLCRDRINAAMRDGHKKAGHTIDLLGCSYDQYMTYLGPNAARMGELELVIDHIWPVKMYNLKDPAEQFNAFNYQNTRLCTNAENLAKGSTPPPLELAMTVPFHLWPAKGMEYYDA